MLCIKAVGSGSKVSIFDGRSARTSEPKLLNELYWRIFNV